MSAVETEEPAYGVVPREGRWAWFCDLPGCDEYGTGCPSKAYAHLEAQIHFQREHA